MVPATQDSLLRVLPSQLLPIKPTIHFYVGPLNNLAMLSVFRELRHKLMKYLKNKDKE